MKGFVTASAEAAFNGNVRNLENSGFHALVTFLILCDASLLNDAQLNVVVPLDSYLSGSEPVWYSQLLTTLT